MEQIGCQTTWALYLVFCALFHYNTVDFIPIELNFCTRLDTTISISSRTKNSHLVQVQHFAKALTHSSLSLVKKRDKHLILETPLKPPKSL